MIDFRKDRSTWWSCICYDIEHINMLTETPDIKGYAYILHDKDIDEKGKKKKNHYHFVVQFFTNQRGSWFNRFTRDDLGQVLVQPTNSPQAAFEYLTHKNHSKKYQYPDSDVISTLSSFEAIQADGDPNQALYDDIRLLVENKITWRELFKRSPKRIHMAANIKTVVELFKTERIAEYEQNYGDLPPEIKKPEYNQLRLVTDEELKNTF